MANDHEKRSLKNFFRHIVSTIRTKKTDAAKMLQEDWNHRLVSRTLNAKKIPNFKQLKKLSFVLSLREKKILKVLAGLTLISVVFLVLRFVTLNSVLVPEEGGEYIEGLVGQPHLLNPVLSSNNETDADLVELLYSGLLRYNDDLVLESDLALSYEMSADQKEYLFHLRPGVVWHDGEIMNADDVVFTANLIKDPEYLSPLRGSLRGVVVEKVDDLTVKFTLKEPYAPFLHALTFGILPEHQWGSVAPKNFALSKLNLEPVGTGPFQADTFKRDDLGTIRSYTLKRNERFYRERPYLDRVTFKFYASQSLALDALKNKSILALGNVPSQSRTELQSATADHLEFYQLQLPQYSALFFNTKQNVFLQDKKVREALALSVDRQNLLSLFENGALSLESPFLPGMVGYRQPQKSLEFHPEYAKQLLEEASWKSISADEYFQLQLANERKAAEENKQNTDDIDEDLLWQNAFQQETYRKKGDKILELNLTTLDHPENRLVAEEVQRRWREIGVRVDLLFVDASKIHSQIIRPRKYDVLLYSVLIGSDPDPYPYWHSSQATENGLNLSQFSNKKADILLEQARVINDLGKREQYYFEFQDILDTELPAVFLSSPTYMYAVDKKVFHVSVHNMNLPSDRFSDLETRYLKTRREVKMGDWKNFLWQ